MTIALRMGNKVTSKRLIHIAMPAALSAMLNNAYRVIDQYAVQWLGVDAQAAIASSTFVLIVMFAGYSIISSGVIALLSRAVGANNVALQKQLIGNALGGAFVLGIVILSISGNFAPMTVKLLGLQNGLADNAEIYLRWHALVCLAQTVMPTVDAIFIAYGRTKVVLLLQITATVLNFILNPLFIYVFDFGIAGAAIATGISQTIAVMVGLVLLRKMLQLDADDFILQPVLANIARIGLPMCWGTLMFAGVYWALISLVISPLGPAVNAALGIGFSVLEGFTWPVFWGFSMAVASMVGHSLGAQQPDQAKQIIVLAFKLLTIAGLLASSIFWFGADLLCRQFTKDPGVLAEAVLYAHILAFSQLFVAYEALTEGVLNGAGDTKTILLWSAPLNFLRVPFSWLFAIHFGYGALAIWWVINVSTLLKTLGKGYAVVSGKWQTMKI
jgi:MATE family, multidrug efflux pump